MKKQKKITKIIEKGAGKFTFQLSLIAAAVAVRSVGERATMQTSEITKTKLKFIVRGVNAMR